MKSPIQALLTLTSIAWIAASGRANVQVGNHFDAGPEGWVVVDLTYPTVGSPPPVLNSFAPAWTSIGGNPGGQITFNDLTANVFYWSAPSPYLGNRSAAYGGALDYDLAVTGNGGMPPGFHQEDVVLVGAGLTLVHDTGFAPSPSTTVTWHSFRVELSELGWRRDSLTGAPATSADMLNVLGTLSAVYIRGEYLNALDDIGHLDNVVLSSVGTTFCAGNGSATPCPCGNNAPAGSGVGCSNSLGSGGSLQAQGTAHLFADSLVLRGGGMPNSSALYFQGTTQFNGGSGGVFGDGLRCAGGTTVRLGIKTNAGGSSQYPAAGDPSISVRGLVASPGSRTYQVWYRNAATFCTPSAFNLTNGCAIVWAQ